MQKIIVIVDDSEEFRELVSFQLRKRGHGVLEAGTGEEGLLLLKRVRPDLMLLDGLLPDMNGMQVIARMPKDHVPPAVVFVTAFRALVDDLHRRTLRSGVVAVLRKPMEPIAICDQIERIFGGEQSQPAGPIELPMLPDEALEALDLLLAEVMDVDMSAAESLGVSTDPAAAKDAARAEAEYEEVVAGVRSRFLQSLPGTISDIQAMLGSCVRPGATDRPLSQMRHLVHRAAGTAGTTGLHEVCAVAGLVEHTIVDFESRPGEPDWKDLEARLLLLIDELAAAVARATREHVPEAVADCAK